MAICLAQGCPALQMPAFKDGKPPNWWPDREEVPFKKGFTDLTKPQLMMLHQSLMDHAKKTNGLPADFKRVLYKERCK